MSAHLVTVVAIICDGPGTGPCPQRAGAETRGLAVDLRGRLRDEGWQVAGRGTVRDRCPHCRTTGEG